MSGCATTECHIKFALPEMVDLFTNPVSATVSVTAGNVNTATA
jgi:hypothetical protein